MKVFMRRISYICSDSPLRGIVHQHHYLLLFAWKLKQGILNKTKFEILSNYIRYFYHQGLLAHLKREEEVLFGALSEEHNLRKKLEFGHERIREKVLQVVHEKQVDEEQVESLCRTLVNVVKYEEKELIPCLESKLDDIESSWIKLDISDLDEEIVDEFKPEFWKRAGSLSEL
jgi:hypothetical protein